MNEQYEDCRKRYDCRTAILRLCLAGIVKEILSSVFAKARKRSSPLLYCSFSVPLMNIFLSLLLAQQFLSQQKFKVWT